MWTVTRSGSSRLRTRRVPQSAPKPTTVHPRKRGHAHRNAATLAPSFLRHLRRETARNRLNRRPSCCAVQPIRGRGRGRRRRCCATGSSGRGVRYEVAGQGGAREDEVNNPPAALARHCPNICDAQNVQRSERRGESFSGHLQAEQTLRSYKSKNTHGRVREEEKKSEIM